MLKTMTALMACIIWFTSFPASADPADPGKEISCILRKTSGSWGCLNDTNHESVNVSSVTSDSTQVDVVFSVTATKVRNFLCTPDESDEYGGWSAGASVGLGDASIVLRNASGTAQNPSTMSNSTSGNFWCRGNVYVASGGGGGGSSHAYWSIKNTSSSNSTWHNEIELYDAGGKLTLTSGMLSSTGTGWGAFTAANCVDGSTTNTNCAWLNSGSTGNRIIINLGTATAVNKVAIWSSSGANDVFEVDYSDDGTTWTAEPGSINTTGSTAPHQSYLAF